MDPGKVINDTREDDAPPYATVAEETCALRRALDEANGGLCIAQAQVAEQEKHVAACRQEVQLHCELKCGHEFHRKTTRQADAHYECALCDFVSSYKPRRKDKRRREARDNAAL